MGDHLSYEDFSYTHVQSQVYIRAMRPEIMSYLSLHESNLLFLFSFIYLTQRVDTSVISSNLIIISCLDGNPKAIMPKNMSSLSMENKLDQHVVYLQV